MYPLQMTDIPDQPFHKIAIDLITDLMSSHKKNGTFLQLLTISQAGWKFSQFPYKKTNTISCVFINNYLLVHMCPIYIYYLIIEQSSRICLWMTSSKNLALIESFLPHAIPRVI